MAKYDFTNSLNFYRVFDPDTKAFLGHAWDVIVLPPLRARLKELAVSAGAMNVETQLVEELGSVALAAAGVIQYHPRFPRTLARSLLRQDTLMPAIAAAFDFDDWKSRPEIIYLCVLRLIGLELDPLFHDDIEAVINGLGDLDVEVLHADVKQTGRMLGKLGSIHDRRYELKPRPALNIDIVRRLVVVDDANAAKAFIHAVSEKYGGLSYMKCLPDLAGTEGALERYNVLPLMLTVPVAPTGVTVGTLLENPSTQAAWAYQRAHHPAGISTEQWHTDHDRSVAVLESCRAAPVVMHCEIQVMFKKFIPIRLAMHDVYKVCRADAPVQLYEDNIVYDGESSSLPAVTSLHAAATAGMTDTVTAILQASAATVAEGEPTPGVNLHGDTKRTSLHLAALRGHLPVVQALLKHQADPNIVSLDHGSTPILAAKGCLDVVSALIEADANPNLTTTDTNTTALYLAAKNGYADVVDALLQHRADPNVPRSDTRCTSLHLAIKGGHANVLRLLVNANASVDHKSNDGTPLEVARTLGHTKCAEILEAALASLSAQNGGGAGGGGAEAAAAAVAATESPQKKRARVDKEPR